MIQFEINKTVYYLDNITDKPVRGIVINITSLSSRQYALTIRTKTGELITDTINKFSKGYPAICKYWTK